MLELEDAIEMQEGARTKPNQSTDQTTSAK